MNNSHFKEVEEDDTEFYVYHVLTGNVTTEIHYHSSAQLVYAEGGIVHVFTDQKHWYLPARCFMWIPAGTPHYIFSTSQRLIYIIFTLKKKKMKVAF